MSNTIELTDEFIRGHHGEYIAVTKDERTVLACAPSKAELAKQFERLGHHEGGYRVRRIRDKPTVQNSLLVTSDYAAVSRDGGRAILARASSFEALNEEIEKLGLHPNNYVITSVEEHGLSHV